MGDPCTCSWGAPHGEPCYDKRPAQGSDGVARAWTPRERCMLFCDGFRHGAGVRALDPKRQGLAAYDRGVNEGRDARALATSAFAKEVGYEPTFLRSSQDGSAGDG